MSKHNNNSSLAGLFASTVVLVAATLTAGVLLDRSMPALVSAESVTLTDDETLPEYLVSQRAGEIKSPIGMTIYVKRIEEAQ